MHKGFFSLIVVHPLGGIEHKSLNNMCSKLKSCIARGCFPAAFIDAHSTEILGIYVLGFQQDSYMLESSSIHMRYMYELACGNTAQAQKFQRKQNLCKMP